MSPKNLAAWLPAKSVKPLVVGSAPYTPPKEGEIVVRNGAVAINPIDCYKQLLGDILLPYIKYPFVLGGDVAGEVVAVGPGVQHFQVGDRVLGQAAGGAAAANNAAEGGFQHYTVIREYFASVIPEWVSYEQACVLPLTLSTAAYGLFHHEFLALNPPAVPIPPSSAAHAKAIIITGGSTSVGSNAIQLAVSAGYEVYSTASPKNFAYVEGLGAAKVFDYHRADLVDQLIAALKGKVVAGAYAIGDNSVKTCIHVLRRCDGRSKKFVAVAAYTMTQQPEKLGTFFGKVSFFGKTLFCMGRSALSSYLNGVGQKFIDCKELCQKDNVVSRMVYHDFLSRALEAKQFVPAPEPLIVGTGLEKIQDAMDTLNKGVSAQKVVVSL